MELRPHLFRFLLVGVHARATSVGGGVEDDVEDVVLSFDVPPFGDLMGGPSPRDVVDPQTRSRTLGDLDLQPDPAHRRQVGRHHEGHRAPPVAAHRLWVEH